MDERLPLLADQVRRTRAELSEALADPELPGDRARYAEVTRRWASLAEAFGLADDFADALARADEARTLLADGDDADVRGAAARRGGRPGGGGSAAA